MLVEGEWIQDEQFQSATGGRYGEANRNGATIGESGVVTDLRAETQPPNFFTFLVLGTTPTTSSGPLAPPIGLCNTWYRLEVFLGSRPCGGFSRQGCDLQRQPRVFHADVRYLMLRS
jgi:hypothetical protein